MEAQRTDKRILLDIGGDWCPYCHEMNAFFRDHPDVLDLRDRNFITVCIYYGSENKNEAVLSRYPEILGIPHFYVLDEDGRLLHSQHVLELRDKGRYDVDKMREFLQNWAPARGENTKKLN